MGFIDGQAYTFNWSDKVQVTRCLNPHSTQSDKSPQCGLSGVQSSESLLTEVLGATAKLKIAYCTS